MVEAIRTAVGPELGARIGAISVAGLRVHKWRFAVSGGAAADVAACCRDLVDAGTLVAPGGVGTLRFSAEKSEADQLRTGALVRALKAAESVIEDLRAEGRGGEAAGAGGVDWQAVSVRPLWRSFAVGVRGGPWPCERNLVKVGRDAAFAWDAAVLQTLGVECGERLLARAPPRG